MQNLDERFIDAAREGDLDRVREMLDATRKTGVMGSISAKLSGDPFDGTLELYDRNRALSAAACDGHKDIVELLIPVSDPADTHSKALRTAANNGHAEIVQMLIPHSDPNAMEGDALRNAAGNGHLEVVRCLLPHSDPEEWRSGAIRKAATNGHREVVDFLYDHSNVEEALHFVSPSDRDCPGILYLQNRRQAEIDAVKLQSDTQSAAGAWCPSPDQADAFAERMTPQAQGNAQEAPQQQRVRLRL